MENLSDVTFHIPVRFDTMERVRNLRLILTYLLENFETNIILMEEDETPKAKQFVRSFLDRVTYSFVKSRSPYFHRTRLLNEMAKMAKTPVIASYDADTIVSVNRYVQARDLVRNGMDLVYPYGQKFLDVPNSEVTHVFSTMMNHSLPAGDYKVLYFNSVGGIRFFNRETFMQSGMENEFCVSWGCEDEELFIRYSKLDRKIVRTPGSLYHFSHPRGKNSSEELNILSKRSTKERAKMLELGQEQIYFYIATWDWLPARYRKAALDRGLELKKRMAEKAVPAQPLSPTPTYPNSPRPR